MMNLLDTLFGEKDLNTLQMCNRGIIVFILSLVLMRIAGRRAFGLRTPIDNIIVILLGAILSRTVVGASPFLPVTVTCLLIVLMHRWLCWLIARYPFISHIVQGKKILLYEDGKFSEHGMRRALVCEEDVLQGVRKSSSTDDLDMIERVYMERNGEISAVLKNRSEAAD